MANQTVLSGIVGRRPPPIRLPPPPLQPPPLDLLQSYSDWRDDWTHIVAGRFTASPYSGLLFYEQSTGVAEFYTTDGNGNISLLKHYDDWPTTWTHIVPGIFGKSGYTGLLLYDQAAGFGAIYDTDGNGNLILIQQYNDWRTTWTQIVAARFTASTFSSLLFYEQSAGYGEIYATDGTGAINLLATYSDWRTTWTHIVAADFVNSDPLAADWPNPPIDDLFFFEGSTGYCETYESDGSGGISLSCSQSAMPPATAILAGSFGGGPQADLIFYDQATGTATIRMLQGTEWQVTEQYNWASPWDLMVAGNFWMADPLNDRLLPDGAFTDLLFYEGATGEIYLHEPPSPTPIDSFAGYVNPRSVQPGDVIGFFVSSQVGPYSITIYRQSQTRIRMTEVSGLPSAPTPFPITRIAYATGAQWPQIGQLTIPETWPSGLYFATVTALPTLSTLPLDGPPLAIAPSQGASAVVTGNPQTPPLDIPFIVRPPSGTQARILVAVSDNTYEAYNFWGGRDLYGFGHDGQHSWVYPSSAPFRAPYGFHLSFLRPFASNSGATKWQDWEVPFIQWLSRQGFLVDLCTESDLHFRSGLLDGYRLLVLVGHSEYWSGPMRDQVEGFVKKGGNVAFFAGNVCWWQVRFDDYNTMVCYKQRDFDPASQFAGTLPETTVNWYQPYLHRPETLLTGVRYVGGVIDPAAGFQYTVADAGHWVFANTGLANGDTFGLYDNGALSVVGGETDSLAPDSPSNLQVLASIPVADGGNLSTIGLFSPAANAGTVFTVGTIDWALGLSQDDSWNVMDQITRNVLIRLG